MIACLPDPPSIFKNQSKWTFWLPRFGQLGFEVELMTDFRAGFYSTLSQHHCCNIQDGHFAHPAECNAYDCFSIYNKSADLNSSIQHIWLYMFVKPKNVACFCNHFLHLFQCLPFVEPEDGHHLVDFQGAINDQSCTAWLISWSWGKPKDSGGLP